MAKPMAHPWDIFAKMKANLSQIVGITAGCDL
jgi:hypothetical protein